ncbi:hypothetical protein HPP92_028210 [Vanilla planifolia]|uniref:Thioredoxin domain-containing protein n=1 Tax=Vanilla planifolia TaxID=51239 RepID=A0A835P9Y7_VANPL|nr:hypothetical protein HPP92_028205 [Vanilla planifolia]KAG0447683.1 hypothetical protein HPP92_028210 [Vanilla planifolia]
MAEVLSQGKVFSPCGRRSSYVPPNRIRLFASLSRRAIEPEKFPSSTKGVFLGKKLLVDCKGGKSARRNIQAVPIKMGLSIGKAMRWWEKGIQPNMRGITSAQDLVDSLLNAGDKLVIVDFFSPGCAGCKSLHPKICQLAEQNPDVLFLQVNHEEHRSMGYSLNVHVLPFFKFYRGAHGRLCSFSCTIATIKKFKDALAIHSTERCSLGPTKGLEEFELLALAANKDLCFEYTRKEELVSAAPEVKEIAPDMPELPLLPVPITNQGSEDKTLAAAGRKN